MENMADATSESLVPLYLVERRREDGQNKEQLTDSTLYQYILQRTFDKDGRCTDSTCAKSDFERKKRAAEAQPIFSRPTRR